MPRPRLFYGWVIVAIAFVSLGLGYSIWYSFTVFFLAMLEEFGWSRADTAWAFSVFVIVHGLSGPPLGVLVERWGLRRVMPLGALFLGAALAACSLVSTAWQYYLTFGVLTSIGVTTVGVIPSYTALNRWFVKRRGMVLGIASAGIGLLGILILVPFNQYLISTVGWRAAYLVLAAIVAGILTPLTYLLVKERPQDIGLQPDGGEAATARHLDPSAQRSAGNPRWVATEWTPRRAMRTGRFWALAMCFCMVPVATQTVFIHLAAYLVDLEYDKFLAAAVIGLIGFISIPAKIGWGLASDRLGREVTFSAGMGCLALSLVLLLAMPGAGAPWLIYVFALLFGAGYSVNAPVNPAVAGDLFSGKHFGVIYGWLGIAGNFGAALGPWLAGYLFDVGGSYTSAYLIAIAAVVVAGALIWLVAPGRVLLAGSKAAGTGWRAWF